MNNKTLLGIAVGIVFLIGAGYIVYMGRPVMNMADPAPAATSTTQVATSSTPIATEPTTTIVATPSPTTSTKTATKLVPTQPKPTSTVATPTPTPTPTPSPIPEPAPQPGTYTLAEVETHNTPSNCWAAISGDVYDLTSWVSRHPGGENPIKNLCGTDGTARFERKHGGSNAAKMSLGLLKIGTLR